MRLIDLTGKKFGRLTVIKRAVSTSKNAKWVCKCDCGNFVTVFGTDLKSGKTKSCGCIHSEQLKNRNHKHGLSDTRIMSVWRSMKYRCYNPKCKAFSNYGGRGIVICEEWKHNFQSFYDWAISHGYADDLTIDRIDVNGNYEPSNCRWIPLQEQQSNKRNNHFLTYKGETKTVAQWAKDNQIKRCTLQMRLKRGWSIERAINTP